MYFDNKANIAVDSELEYENSAISAPANHANFLTPNSLLKHEIDDSNAPMEIKIEKMQTCSQSSLEFHPIHVQIKKESLFNGPDCDANQIGSYKATQTNVIGIKSEPLAMQNAWKNLSQWNNNDRKVEMPTSDELSEDRQVLKQDPISTDQATNVNGIKSEPLFIQNAWENLSQWNKNERNVKIPTFDELSDDRQVLKQDPILTDQATNVIGIKSEPLSIQNAWENLSQWNNNDRKVNMPTSDELYVGEDITLVKIEKQTHRETRSSVKMMAATRQVYEKPVTGFSNRSKGRKVLKQEPISINQPQSPKKPKRRKKRSGSKDKSYKVYCPKDIDNQVNKIITRSKTDKLKLKPNSNRKNASQFRNIVTRSSERLRNRIINFPQPLIGDQKLKLKPNSSRENSSQSRNIVTRSSERLQNRIVNFPQPLIDDQKPKVTLPQPITTPKKWKPEPKKVRWTAKVTKKYNSFEYAKLLAALQPEVAIKRLNCNKLCQMQSERYLISDALSEDYVDSIMSDNSISVKKEKEFDDYDYNETIDILFKTIKTESKNIDKETQLQIKSVFSLSPVVRLKHLQLDSLGDKKLENKLISISKEFDYSNESPCISYAPQDDSGISTDIETSSQESADIVKISNKNHENAVDLHLLLEIAIQRALINALLKENGFTGLNFKLYNNIDELKVVLDYLLEA